MLHTRRLQVPPLSWERWRHTRPFTSGKPGLLVVARPSGFHSSSEPSMWMELTSWCEGISLQTCLGFLASSSLALRPRTSRPSLPVWVATCPCPFSQLRLCPPTKGADFLQRRGRPTGWSLATPIHAALLTSPWNAGPIWLLPPEASPGCAHDACLGSRLSWVAPSAAPRVALRCLDELGQRLAAHDNLPLQSYLQIMALCIPWKSSDVRRRASRCLSTPEMNC